MSDVANGTKNGDDIADIAADSEDEAWDEESGT